jgi:hypothetical protein
VKRAVAIARGAVAIAVNEVAKAAKGGAAKEGAIVKRRSRRFHQR